MSAKTNMCWIENPTKDLLQRVIKKMEPIEFNDELFERLTAHDLEIFKLYNAGTYEKENLVLIANKDISSLYDYILICMVEKEDGLPDYAKCRFLTFDDIELKAGDRVRIYTCKGEDQVEMGTKTGKHYEVLYWNLDAPVWNIPHSSIKIMERGDSYSKMFL